MQAQQCPSQRARKQQHDYLVTSLVALFLGCLFIAQSPLHHAFKKRKRKRKNKRLCPIITQTPSVSASNQEIKRGTEKETRIWRTLCFLHYYHSLLFLCRVENRLRFPSFPKTLLYHSTPFLVIAHPLAFHQLVASHHKRRQHWYCFRRCCFTYRIHSLKSFLALMALEKRLRKRAFMAPNP